MVSRSAGAETARPAADWVVLPLTAAVAGVTGATGNLRLAAGLVLLPAAASVLLVFLQRPAVWVPVFLFVAIVSPPLPILVGSGTIHPALAVSAGALFVAWARISEWRIREACFPLFLLPAALLVSVPWAFFYSGTAVGFESLARWFFFAHSFLIFAWLTAGPGADSLDTGTLAKTVLCASLVAGLFAVLDFLLQFPAPVPFSAQFLFLPEGVFRRAQGAFYDANALGNFCAIVIVLIAALERRACAALRIPAWLRWAPLPFLLAATVLSFSRSSMLNALVGLAVVAWMRRRQLPFRRMAAGTALLGAGTGFALYLLAPGFAARYALRLEYTLLEFFSKPNEVLSNRLETWASLAAFIAGHPLHLLLGIGYKTLPHTSYLGNAVIADNMYLTLAVEAGIPAVLALLVFSAALLKLGWRLSRVPDPVASSLGVFLLAAWSGEMVQMLSVDVLTYWRVTPVLLAFLGLAVAEHRRWSEREPG